MCARLLACPLCSQPGFLTVDALRAGLVSVATRPLICPVCNEVLLGIDKLTIHLFGHAINLMDNAHVTEPSKRVDIVVPNERSIAIHNAPNNLALQDWSASKAQQQLDKVQTLNILGHTADDGICIKSSETDTLIRENKISIVNSQSRAQSHNLFVGNANQHNFVTDYDLIKVNILPLDNVKHSDVSEESIQAEREKTAITLNLLTAIKVAETVDANIYQNIERESNERVVEGESAINLTDEENDVGHFQSIQSTLPTRADVSAEGRNDEEILFNAKKETMLETTNDHQEQRMKRKEILSETVASLEAATSKEKTERCNTCGFNFSDANILALHVQLVHEQDSNDVSKKIFKNYSCHLCSKVFKMRGSLMVHMRVAHVGRNLGSSTSKDGQTGEFASSDAGYNCPTCGKRFRKEQHVIQHLKTHEGKQWECDICSKMFTTKYFLKKHKRLHSGEMPYKCKICDKSFTFQQSYHKHRLYHKDDKPHTCTTCGRSFKELSTLHNHERIHTGEKPFACETCGKCFRQRVSYLVHRRIHTGVMPYKCTMCGKSFRYKVSQRTHKCPARALGNTRQSCNDAIAQGTDNGIIEPRAIDTLPDGRTCPNVLSNEDKFILMINDEGQHVLALQSDINDASSKKKEQDVDFQDTKGEKTKNKPWNSTNLNSMEYGGSAGSMKKMQSNNIKLGMNERRNDFFSMVMSPFDNGMASSTFEMEHLRVSSPKRREDSVDYIANFPEASDSAPINIVKLNAEENFSRDKNVNDPLQTINEESLKELLYGMDRK